MIIDAKNLKKRKETVIIEIVSYIAAHDAKT